jgi:hypothetical protein
MITITKKIANAAATEFRVLDIVTNIHRVMPATTTFLILAATH